MKEAIGRKESGLTLLESLTVISIVALLASLTYPTLLNGIREAKKARSMSQMRQIHAALLVYVENEEGEGPLGLGLPPSLLVLRQVEKLPRSLFETGGNNWKAPSYPAVYTWLPPHPMVGQEDLMDRWHQYVDATSRNPALILDETFTSNFGQFSMKSAFAIFFDGHIETRRARGSMTDYDLWR